jgi:hypothetical protein
MGVLQVFDRFYVESKDDRSPSPGDIYWVPVPYIEEVPRVLDVRRADPRDHQSIEYEIQQVQPHHFTERPGRLPIKLLTLHATEELLIAKAKRRPAVVLCSNCVNPIAGLSRQEERLGKSLARNCHIVAPLYSTSTPRAPGTFSRRLWHAFALLCIRNLHACRASGVMNRIRARLSALITSLSHILAAGASLLS